MFKRRFTVESDQSVEDAIRHMARLLTQRSVDFNLEDGKLISVRTPIPPRGVQVQGCSHSKSIGVNPFLYTDRVMIDVTANGQGSTIKVEASFIRAYVPLFPLFALSAALWNTPAAYLFPVSSVIYILYAFVGVILGAMPYEVAQCLKGQPADADCTKCGGSCG